MGLQTLVGYVISSLQSTLDSVTAQGSVITVPHFFSQQVALLYVFPPAQSTAQQPVIQRVIAYCLLTMGVI